MRQTAAPSSTLLTDRIGRIAGLTEPAAKLLNLPVGLVEREYFALALFFSQPRHGIYLGLRDATLRPSEVIKAVLQPRQGPSCPVQTRVRERPDGFLEWTIDRVQ
jgi:hypothetical protein